MSSSSKATDRARRRAPVLGSVLALALACGGSRAGAPPAASAEAAPAGGGAASGGPDRSVLPEPGPPPAWAPPAPTSWKLGPSSRVLYRKYGSVPLVSLNLVIPHGSETDPVGKDGLTSLMADLLDEGAGQLDALALSERLLSLATDLRIMAGTDSIQISMRMIAENFGPSVDILADVVRRPKLSEKEFQRRKAQLIAQAIASEADPHFGRRAAMSHALFGNGYGGGVTTGTRDTLEAISYADVKAHYKRLMAGDDAAFVVVGGIEQDAVTDQLKRAFGDWGGQFSGEARALVPAPGNGKLYFVNYPGAAQSVIGVMRRAPGAEAEDLFPSTIFSRSFGEAFTSRVNLNLREDKGYTYGAFSTFQRYRQAGFFGVFSDVRTDVTRQSLDEILRELAEICGPRPLTAQERDDSVGGLLLGYPATFESIELLGSRFTQIPLYNRPLDWFERWPSRIAAVTVEQANQAAHSYCPRTEFGVVVAGDAAKVVPTLDGIGFDLVKVDARGLAL